MYIQEIGPREMKVDENGPTYNSTHNMNDQFIHSEGHSSYKNEILRCGCTIS